jgi:hypothetical protein
VSQQYNKVIKRRRRVAYLKRKALATKARTKAGTPKPQIEAAQPETAPAAPAQG